MKPWVAAAAAMLIPSGLWLIGWKLNSTLEREAQIARDSKTLLNDATSEAVIARGDEIVAAIHRFHSEKGSLPASLSEIETTLGITLPPSPLSTPWRYRQFTEGGAETYELSIAPDGEYPKLYKRADSPWRLDN